MDWDGEPMLQMEQKPSSLLSFFGRRSIVPRPLSEATDFYDLDDAEDSDGSSPLSFQSMDDDSQTTISAPDEVSTPNTNGLGEFEFHFDPKQVAGPNGPHMFRSSSTELPIGLDDTFTAELIVDSEPKPAPESQPTFLIRPFTALNSAVAELDESQVRAWTPHQVADWMKTAGFEAVVADKFVVHDISGTVLLDLQFEDLKELDISSFGKRHRVMSSIQHLRNSSIVSPVPTLVRSPVQSVRALQRPVLPEESHVVPDRSLSRRRGRSIAKTSDIVTPAESISIVAIEQLLPKPHKCSKGEDCHKWQKQQRKLERIQQEFAEEVQIVESVPSVVGSSDVLGPSQGMQITPERLSEVMPRDPQDNVRQFLTFQMHSTTHAPSPPPAASASFAVKPNLTENLRGLPKLTIPAEHHEEINSARSPIPALRNSMQMKAQEKLSDDPYHYGGVASPVDVYRLGSPFSANDVPVTAEPVDPCGRVISQSVPPEMRYGAQESSFGSFEPLQRSLSTVPSCRRRTRRPSFNPSVAPVDEDAVLVPASAVPTLSRPPIVTTESQDFLDHAGWMRKRRTTKLLRHEWEDHYYSLTGNRLFTMESDIPDADTVDSINMDDYAVHAYSKATGSKLSAAFKKSILGAGYVSSSQPSFAFSLIPDNKVRSKSFSERSAVKSHHFAVKTSNDRVEWMRRLMLAKAAGRNETANIL